MIATLIALTVLSVVIAVAMGMMSEVHRSNARYWRVACQDAEVKSSEQAADLIDAERQIMLAKSRLADLSRKIELMEAVVDEVPLEYTKTV